MVTPQVPTLLSIRSVCLKQRKLFDWLFFSLVATVSLCLATFSAHSVSSNYANCFYILLLARICCIMRQLESRHAVEASCTWFHLLENTPLCYFFFVFFLYIRGKIQRFWLEISAILTVYSRLQAGYLAILGWGVCGRGLYIITTFSMYPLYHCYLSIILISTFLEALRRKAWQ